MKKLKVTFLKGFVLFLVIGILWVIMLHRLRIYFESEIFRGEMPQEYKLIALLITSGLMILLAIPTMIQPARAINIEKDRRITQWGITGVRPEDQEMDTRKKE